jgi:hypothetical protein
MNYVKNHNTFGVETKEIPCIVGKGAPSIITNVVGLLYMDEDTGEVYKRTADGWVLLVEIPDTPNIYVADSKPTDLTPYEIGDIILVKEA